MYKNLKIILDKIIYKYLTSKLLEDDKYLVTISDTSQLDSFITQVINKKKFESHHQFDSFNEEKRWRTGFGGEMALEKFLNKKFVDLSIGNSNDYHVPDLSKLGLNVGIKTVEIGKYPIIFKRSNKPEIIILKINDNTFNICGLASVDVLNTYQDDDQILSPSLKARGTKTGFVGLYKLKRFSNFDELRTHIFT